ncbi:MAG TPA: hypothetical protein VJ259_04080, partial [Actinomycetota bacterium]|nr:hypothetical protein [Actinomycetota bacterium]
MDEHRAIRLDVALYLAGAAVAGMAALSDRIPIQRDWGRMAFVPYAGGALVALVLAIAWRRSPARVRARARIGAAVAVLAGAALVPMALEVWWRARDGFAGHVQSEVLVTEGSADALLSGSN